jgi:hypothetical protein
MALARDKRKLLFTLGALLTVIAICQLISYGQVLSVSFTNSEAPGRRFMIKQRLQRKSSEGRGCVTHTCVFFDVTFDAVPGGRIIFLLYDQKVPIYTPSSFVLLCVCVCVFLVCFVGIFWGWSLDWARDSVCSIYFFLFFLLLRFSFHKIRSGGLHITSSLGFKAYYIFPLFCLGFKSHHGLVIRDESLQQVFLLMPVENDKRVQMRFRDHKVQ